MTGLATARALRRTGLGWDPVRGDRFVIPDRDMDADVFVLSDMTIEAHEFPTGRVLGFNGTTEWALDSMDQSEALWLPAEDQLREILGTSFHALTRTADGYRVVTTTRSTESAYDASTAADAYALAVLAALETDR
jgi:hypothetical protein